MVKKTTVNFSPTKYLAQLNFLQGRASDVSIKDLAHNYIYIYVYDCGSFAPFLFCN